MASVAMSGFAKEIKIGTVFSTDRAVGHAKFLAREYYTNKNIIVVLKNITKPDENKARPAKIKGQPGVCQWYRGGYYCGKYIHGQSTELIKSGNIDKTVLILCKGTFPIMAIPLFAPSYVYKLQVVGISPYVGGACPEDLQSTKALSSKLTEYTKTYSPN